MPQSKTIPELAAEKAANEARIAQLRHQNQRTDNRIRHHDKGERTKRNHRLITRGAAIESIAPAVKELSEAEFYAFAKRVFALPEVDALLTGALEKHDSTETKERC